MGKLSWYWGVWLNCFRFIFRSFIEEKPQYANCTSKTWHFSCPRCFSQVIEGILRRNFLYLLIDCCSLVTQSWNCKKIVCTLVKNWFFLYIPDKLDIFGLKHVEMIRSDTGKVRKHLAVSKSNWVILHIGSILIFLIYFSNKSVVSGSIYLEMIKTDMGEVTNILLAQN